MRLILFAIILTLLPRACFDNSDVSYEIRTSMGNIEIVTYPDKAPITSANFASYVDSGAYDGSSFFRVTNLENEAERDVQIQVIQGGNVDDKFKQEPIRLETTEQTGLRHSPGAVSMARGAAHTATSSFFICLQNEAELDFGGARHDDGQGFAVFGKVTKGIGVVEAINGIANKDQRLTEPVEIIEIVKL